MVPPRPFLEAVAGVPYLLARTRSFGGLQAELRVEVDVRVLPIDVGKPRIRQEYRNIPHAAAGREVVVQLDPTVASAIKVVDQRGVAREVLSGRHQIDRRGLVVGIPVVVEVDQVVGVAEIYLKLVERQVLVPTSSFVYVEANLAIRGCANVSSWKLGQKKRVRIGRVGQFVVLCRGTRTKVRVIAFFVSAVLKSNE